MEFRITDEMERPDAPKILGVHDLGGRGALYLCALLQAQRLGQPLAPTQEYSRKIASCLDILGIICTEPTAANERHPTPCENMRWTYTWARVPLAGLAAQLTSHLSKIGRDRTYAATWLAVWKELLHMEVLAFLRTTLSESHFGTHAVEEVLANLEHAHPNCSLGNWQYACSAAVRSMISVRTKHPCNVELLNYTLRNELSHRLALATSGQFIQAPISPTAMSAVSRLLASIALLSPETFWRAAPDEVYLAP